MTPWARATLALQLLSVDPDGLGGIVLHARSGPVRDAFQALIGPNVSPLHPAVPLDVLTGGIDVARSLGSATLVRQEGLLHGHDRRWQLSMAERTTALLAGTLATALDARRGHSLIAFDEHTEDEAPPPAALLDRLAFHVSLEGLSLRDVENDVAISDTETALVAVIVPEHAIEDLVRLAVALGVDSLRAPYLAINAARAHAALFGRTVVDEADICAAAELVLGPRATKLPREPDLSEEASPPPEHQPSSGQPQSAEIPQDILLAAVATALPPDLLAKTGSNKHENASGSGAGQKRIGNRRGRPLPPRDGNKARSDGRVDLVATLRAAVPWQKIRKAGQAQVIGPVIRPSDLRHKRFEDLSDRLLIFTVDASGSAALARLAEAKGAVELLLSEAYARRDHVALISFRGKEAEVLLPPTRSLVQTKRRLADLPGGGGTPLASGLKCALETGVAAKRKGLSPVIVLLTDGRSNVALDGSPDRKQAGLDANALAKQVAQHRMDTLVIDTGRRPERGLADMAASLRGQYLSLPRANAQTLSAAVNSALGD